MNEIGAANADTERRATLLCASWLFVPASRSDRFSKALGSGADAVVFDLEDAVAPSEKDASREILRMWDGYDHRSFVRMNSFESIWWEQDLELMRDIDAVPVIPKAEDPGWVAEVVRQSRASRAVVLVESATGLSKLEDLTAIDGVERVMFGSVDYATDIGTDPANREALAYARGRLVTGSRAAGLPPPIDGPTLDLSHATGLIDDSRSAKGLGFAGKVCVHPFQVRHVNRAFSVSGAEIDWARTIMGSAPDEGVSVVAGAMVDAPVLARARSILRQAEEEMMRKVEGMNDDRSS
ncbi:CoA ester lyase [Mycolicibacterium sp. 624]|uniref:HpcH/HpaI aldolase/citrate lyase family protein n=1 Tax=Mycolicibacterium sp. 624 TaxID=3156314 RepID=UPI0033970DD7